MGCGFRHGHPAQDRVDPEKQLLRLERLAEIVVRPGLEPADAVLRLAARGQEQDRRVDLLPERPGEAQPVLARHHHVEHDEIEFEPREKPPRMRRVARGRDEKAVSDQELLEKPPDAFVVVDDEEVDRRARSSRVLLRAEMTAHVGVHHRLEHGAEAAHGLRARLAVGRAHPGALRVGQLALERLARGRQEQVPLAPVLLAHAAFHQPVLDQRAEHAVQRLLGDAEDARGGC
jgi:hypothetical protein